MIRRLILAGLFTVLTALASMVVRKLLDQAWETTKHAPAPTKEPSRYDTLTKTIWAAVTGLAASFTKMFLHRAEKRALHRA